jgi:diaminopimelate epimerase
MIFYLFLIRHLKTELKQTFYKYHGTGNDFILIDNRDGGFLPDEKLVAHLCHRRFGIGANGLILLNKADGYDFRMVYFNSDGRESTMCGNGGRCIVAFSDFLSASKMECRFISIDGEHEGTILSKDGGNYRVRLSMNDVAGYGLHDEDFIINTGSPHYVRFTKDINNVDVVAQGRLIRNLPDFSPAGINVNFVQADNERLLVRTYERGVEDETLSCGTGVTASALAFAAKTNLSQGTVPIVTRGGNLDILFQKAGRIFTGIYIEGPAVQVFSGSLDTACLDSIPDDQLLH